MRFKLGSEDWAKLALSPDGQHVLAHWREGTSMRRCLDGRELPPAFWKKGHRPEAFAAEGLGRVAWLERSDKCVTVVVSGQSGEERLGPFDEVSVGGECFSVDGRHFTFAFERDGNSWVWFDGRELGPFSAAEKPAIVGARLVFEARRGRQHVVSIAEQEHDASQAAFAPKVAEDGTFAFCFKRGGKFFVRFGSEVLGPFQSRPGFEVGSGGRIAVEHESEGTTRVELDGRLASEFSGRVVSLRQCFSPDGQRFGFAYNEGNYAGFCLDGERRGGLGTADGPWWSADSKHVAWGADDKSGLLVVDGLESQLKSRIDFEEGSSFRFSPDGVFCCVLSDEASGNQLLRIGDRQFGPFFVEGSARRSEYEQVAFSADAALFAFKYRDAESRSFVRAGERTFGPFDSRSEFTLTPDGVLHIAVFDPESLEVRLERHAP